MAMAFERAFGTIGKGTQMTDSETLTQLRADIDAADCMLGDAGGLLQALQGMMERYDPSTSGDDLTSTPMWNLMHCASEKVYAASELINPSEVNPPDEVRAELPSGAENVAAMEQPPVKLEIEQLPNGKFHLVDQNGIVRGWVGSIEWNPRHPMT
jgi:hypothetical protein